jgi:uncharacterized protein YciI
MDVPITKRWVLIYDFIEADDIVERRAPFRPEHIAQIRDGLANGSVLLAGALGDPPSGGLLVFDVEDPAEVERFAQADPYVTGGLVASWRVEPWALVS